MLIHKLCNTLSRRNLLTILSRHDYIKSANISTTSTCNGKHIQYEVRHTPKAKMLLHKQNGLIIGGTSGIGLETAHWLLIAGCKHVIVAGPNKEKCLKSAQLLNNCYGKGKASCICLDVRDPKEYEEALMYAIDKVCSLDILVNSFGMLNGEKWEEEMILNVNCVIRGTLLAYDFMGIDSVGFGGVIINVAGTMGLEPMSGAPTFAACKHAVVGFSRSYGNTKTESETKVRLVTLCPGFTRTKLWDDTTGKAMRFCEWELEKNLLSAKKQMPKACGKSVLYLAKYADTGSVWVIEGSRLFEMDFPHRKCYSRHAQTFT